MLDRKRVPSMMMCTPPNMMLIKLTNRGAKAARLVGEFKRANFHDNGTAVDKFGIVKHLARRAFRAEKGSKKLAGIDEEASTCS